MMSGPGDDGALALLTGHKVSAPAASRPCRPGSGLVLCGHVCACSCLHARASYAQLSLPLPLCACLTLSLSLSPPLLCWTPSALANHPASAALSPSSPSGHSRGLHLPVNSLLLLSCGLSPLVQDPRLQQRLLHHIVSDFVPADVAADVGRVPSAMSLLLNHSLLSEPQWTAPGRATDPRVAAIDALVARVQDLVQAPQVRRWHPAQASRRRKIQPTS